MVRTARLWSKAAAPAAALIALAGAGAAHAAAAPQWSTPQNLMEPTSSSSADALRGALLRDGTALTQWTDWNLSLRRFASITGNTVTSGSFDLSGAFGGLAFSGGGAPQIVELPDGTAVTALQARNPLPDVDGVAVSEYNAGTRSWSLPTLVDEGGAEYYQEAPSVAVTPNGDVTIVYFQWNDTDSRGVTAVTRPAGAGAWSAPVTIETPRGIGEDPVLQAVGLADGRVAAVWLGRNDGGDRALRSSIRSAGGSWSTPADITDPSSDVYFRTQQELALAGDGKGNATLAWTNETFGDVSSASLATGSTQWSAPERRIDPGNTPTYGISLSVNAAGDAAIGWRQAPGTTTAGRAPVFPTDAVALRPRGGTWTTTTLSGIGNVTTPHGPVVSVDASGNVTAATYDSSDQLVALRAPVSSGAFSAPQRIDSSPDYVTQNLDYAQLTASTAADGSVSVAWAARRPADDFRTVRASTLDTAGPVQSAVNIPSTAKAGTAASFSLTAKDVLSETGATTWSFGDGGTATGTAASHTYAKAGTYAVKVTSVDQYGNESVTTREITVTGGAPACSGTRKGTKITVKCELASAPAGRIKINGKVQRIKKDGSWGKVRDKARTYTSSRSFTLYFDVRSARKGNYALTLTPAGQPRVIVSLSV